MNRTAFAALWLLAAPVGLSALTTNAAPSTNTPPAAPASPFPNAIPNEQIISRSEATLTEYAKPTPTQADRVEDEVRRAMAEKRSELQLYAQETARLLSENPSLDSIRTLENHGSYFAAFPLGWNASLEERVKDVGKQLDEAKTELTAWKDTQAALAAEKPAVSSDFVRRAAQAVARLTEVRADLTARQARLWTLENQVSEEYSLITSALANLSAARNRAVSQLFEMNAPPVWSSQTVPELGQGGTFTLAQQWATLTAYVRSEPEKFVIHGILLALLIGGFFWLRGFARKLTQEEPGIAPAAGLFEMPVAAGGLLGLFASSFLYYPIAPRLLFAIIGAIALVPSIVLVRRLIEKRLFPVLYALVAFFLLEELRSVAAFNPAAGRAFLLAEIFCAVCFLGWLLLSLRRAPLAHRISPLMRFAGWIAFAALASGWMADVLGYTLLANLICVNVQRSATLGLALYAAIRILEALLFILVRLRPLSGLGMMQEHRALILERAQRILIWAAGLWWTILTLGAWPSTTTLGQRLFGSSVGSTSGWLGHYKPDHSYALNFAGKLLVAGLIIWAAFQASRFTRFILEAEFFPRLRLSAGIPYAISRTLHYAVLVLAFIGATFALGIDMTKFTILVSAFGVGVGFGLQNIINNFVSGLILLFERPVKIGDTIQTGADNGTVERIGIRASVLRTPAGTEVIVPNGSLISNNVTNWTLSDEQRIILIPLNVPRGQDLTHLVALLTETAAAHPKVLKNPPPQVLAQTLGPNLGLELRAWTGESEGWSTVRSELVLAVNAAMTQANITLA